MDSTTEKVFEAVGGPTDHTCPEGTFTKSGRIPVSQVNMIEKALRQGWITPEKAEELAPQRMLEILQRHSPRGWVAATKVLDAMKRTTLASVDTALRARAQTELDGEVAALKARIEGDHDHVDSVDADRGEAAVQEGPASQASPDVG